MIEGMADRPIYVPVSPGRKNPISHNWGNECVTWRVYEYIRKHRRPGANVGVILGPGSGLIDVEFDTADGGQRARELLGTALDNASSWQSTRSPHHLFRFDDRLADLPNVVMLEGIECRLGTDGQTQSVIPPSTVDGVTRTWIRQGTPQPLPESFIERLLATPPKQKPKATGIASTSDTEIRDRMLARFERWCARHDIPYEVEIKGTSYKITFAFDLIRGREHTRGANVVYVNLDGSYGYDNKHSECADKKWKDVEVIHGPLIPVVRVTDDLELAVDETISAIGDCGIYQLGSILTRVCHPEKPLPNMLVDPGTVRLEPLAKSTLREKIKTYVRHEKWNPETEKYQQISTPGEIVSTVFDRGEYHGIPQIFGVNQSPILRPDGIIVRRPGYDCETGRFLDIDDDYPPMMPANKAVETLLDVVCDFPFASDNHRSAWLAAMITAVSRSAFSGSSPLFLFDANASRAGKGLLVDVISTIASGAKAARFDTPTSPEEWNKTLLAIALSGIALAVFDNVKGRFGGSAIENALTAGRYAGRILGVNKTISVAVTWGWQATANNCTLTTDMIGRTVPCRIEPLCEDPGSRADFRYPRLLDHVRVHRRELVIAALSIPAQFIKAGSPAQNLKPFGGFEEWSDLVRQSIVWSGQADCDRRQELADTADTERDLLSLFIEGWPAGQHRVGDAIRQKESHAPLDQAIQELTQAHRNMTAETAVGNYLRSNRRRVVDGKYLDRTEGTKPKWFVGKVAA